jgi:hypothetical protein
MSALSDSRFELKKITESEWLILDHKYEENDARRTVACIYELGGVEVEVVWLRDLPLANYYMFPTDVLEDVQRFHLPARAKAPIPIRHRPPLAPTG